MSQTRTAALLALAVLATGAWAWPEPRVNDPLIDLHALLAGPALRANLATIGLGWALFGGYLLIPSSRWPHRPPRITGWERARRPWD